MDMQRYVASALKDLVVDGQVIPTSFVARGETNLPLVVFNVTSETGKVFWEDDEQIIKYNVMINIFSKGNFVKIKQEVMNRMLEHGFRRSSVDACIYLEDTEIYNQPMAFDFNYEK